MTSFNVDEARKKILELTQNDSNISNRNVFKETLRQLKSIFGSLYYTDGNNNKIKINCTTGKQERAVAKLIQENNLVLPLITITENGISEDNSRLRNTNLLVHEVVWDPEEKRAKRTLSLPPRPINLSFTINIWTKYMEDMDMIRSNILGMFNPYLSIDTKFSDFTIAYMREEADIVDPTAPDNSDRLVQKTITLTVQTYVPSPKFLYTNTGEIKAFKADVTIDSTTETLSLINPPASIPDEEYSSSGGPFNTGLTLSGSLDDVEIIEVNIGQVLAWNGSYWIPSSVAGGGGGAGTFDHQELNNRLVSGAHPQYVLSSTNLTLSSNVSAHIASASVHFTSGSLSAAYVLSSTNSNLSSLVSNLQTSTASISSVVNSHLASASVHFTSGSLSGAYVLTSTNSALSSLVDNHIGSAVHWELNTLNQNYINASGDSANAGFYLSSVSATNISATNYYNLPSATLIWPEAEDIVLLVRNQTGATLPIGTPVTISGIQGDVPIVTILSAVNTHVPEAYGFANHVAGLVRTSIANNQNGYITVEGLIEGGIIEGINLNTSPFAEGDSLYVSSNGQLTNVRPPAPYESHPVGIVVRSGANNGKILVKIENSPELNDIVGFNLNSNILDGDIISYDLTTSTFVNKQTVTVSGLGRFGSVSATSVSSIHLSSTYVSANTILTNKLAVGGSDGYIYNPDGDLYISATNGKVKFNTGFEVTGTISGTSISATTYLNLPSGTAIWNANQLQGRNVATNAPAGGDALVWNISQSRWEPSSISTAGGSVTNNPGGSNGDIQFKNGASFSGVASVNYDSATDKLNVTNFSAVNLTATNFTNAKLDDHIASASVHFTSGSLSSSYVLTSINNSLSSLVNNLQASTATVSSVLDSHIGSSTVHFTSGSLSSAYVLISTNIGLSSALINLEDNLAAHIDDSTIHFTSGSLSGAYVLTSTNSALSSLVTNLQASTATISSTLDSLGNSVVVPHIIDTTIHFTSGSLSGAYVLTSTNSALSSLVTNLQASTATISSTLDSLGNSVVVPHIIDTTIHFTSGSLSGAYVLTSVNSSLSSLVTNLQASTASISSVLNSHLGSAVHWNLETLNANYINSSGDSTTATFLFGTVSAATISATTYQNLPPDRIYDIRDYGAVGDGVTNDGLAISAAIEAAFIAGGGTVLFPAGTYLAQRILVKPGVNILGTNKYTSIVKKPAVAGSNTSYGISTGWINGVFEIQSRASIENIFIDGNIGYSDTTGTAGICAMSASGFTIKNVIVSSMGGNGIQLDASYRATLENVEVYKSRRTGPSNTYNNEGVGFFLYFGGTGSNNDVKYKNKIQLLNCVANNNDLDGTICQHQGIEIIGGEYSYNGSNPFPGVWGANGIYIVGNSTVYPASGPAGSTVYDVFPDVKVCNITARGNSEGGICVAISGAVIEGNICYENEGMGIWLQNTQDATLTNNVCFNNGYILNGAQGDSLLPLLEFRAGISMFGFCRNVTVANNIMFENRNLTATYDSGTRRAGQVWGIYVNTERNASLENFIGPNRRFENITVIGNSIRGAVSGECNLDRINFDAAAWQPSTIVNEKLLDGSSIRGYSSIVINSVSSTNYLNLPVSSHNQLLNLTANDHPQYVLSSTNNNLSSLVNDLQASTATVSSIVNAHLTSAVHWELSTLNANYINASGDSSNNGFYFSSLSSTRVSATNYINLPSGSQIWNANQIGSISIGGTVVSPESYHVIYYDFDNSEWGTKSAKNLLELGANFGLTDLIDVNSSSVNPVSTILLDGDPIVWDSGASAWAHRSLGNFAGNIAPELNPYFVSAGGGTYSNSNYRVSSLSAATVSANTFLGGTFRELVSSIHSSSTQLVDVSPNCDSYLINTTTSAVTVRLPNPTTNTGRTILISKIEADGSHRGVTVSGDITDSQTSAITMFDPNESLRFISNGVSWTNLDYQKSFGVVLVAKNNNSFTLTKGTPLRLIGSDNNVPIIGPVSSVSGHVPNAMGEIPHCIGLAEHDFPPSSFGHVISRGLLYGLDTNSLINGDPVYIGENGQLTNTMPMAPFESIHVGIVVLGGTTTDGIIYVDLVHPVYINDLVGFNIPDTIDDNPSDSHYKAIYYTSGTRTFTADYIDHGFLIGLGDNDHPQYASSSVSATINTISGNLNITTSNVNTVSTTLNSHIGSAVHWDLSTLNSNYINASGDSSNNAFYFSSLSAATISATTYENLPVSSLSGLADVLISSIPTTNYVLKWNGTKWAPAADNTGAGGGITDAFTIATDGTNAYEAVGADTLTLSSSDSSITVTQNLGLFNLVVNESNVAHNSLSELTTGDPHTQYALKSLSSTAYWNANKLQGRDVSTTAPTSNQALVYNGTVSAWVPSSLPAGGGGGLTEGITAITDGIITYTLTGAETLQFESRDGSITWEVDYANNPTPVVAKISGDVQESALTHNNLGGLTTGDPHTQYALKSLSSTAYWNANKLQGTDVTSTAPTTNQALVYDGAKWVPSSLPAGGGGGVTFLSALSDVSAPTPTHKDILIYNSSVGRYVDTPIFPRSIAVHADAGANITLTNQPNTEQFFANSNRNIFKADLTYFTQARICARVVTQSASVNSPRLYVEYSTTFTTTVGSFLDIGVSPVNASMSTATYVVSNWIDLVAGAKADVFFTVLQNGGDGTADPALGPVSVEFR